MNIRLRALTTTDIELTLKWNNQDDISSLYSGHTFPVNIEMERKWYEKILYSNFPTTVFGIEVLENAKLIGITLLKDINLINRTSEFAIYIGDSDSKGKGYSIDATLLTLEFGFYKLGLNRIHLKVLENNFIAINLYKKLGFIEEGKLRKSVFKNNEYKNEVLMSILKEELIK